MRQVLILMFLGFGIFAMVAPEGISGQDMETSYTVRDLIRGWGIYCFLVGMLLADEISTANAIRLALFLSIVWHIGIMSRKGYTIHHSQAIVANAVAIIVLEMSSFEYSKTKDLLDR